VHGLALIAAFPATFTGTPITVDGAVDATWASTPAASIANAYAPAMTSAPTAACPTTGTLRALWDGALLYVLVSVTDPHITATDGVEIWIDHFNDKGPKFEEDDGVMTITAPPTTFVANRPQNAIYGNVSSRYLKSYASALQTDSAGAVTGYNVEFAWYLGEHARANGSAFGFDFGINEADGSNTRQCRVFWQSASQNRTTNDNREWGTITLAGYDGSPIHDTFMLSSNLAKATGLVRGIWRDESSLDKAIISANAALTSNDQPRIDKANAALDSALRGLRRTGPWPDPYDLPSVNHLNDPFRFFNGKRVKTLAEWSRRREEIKALMEYYEFGRKPPKPAVIAIAAADANAQARNITVGMTANGRNATFATRLSLPTPAQAAASGKAAPFPVIVALDPVARDGNANYLDAGYAVLSIASGGVQSDNVAHTGALFDLYPYDVAAGQDVGCLMGWAWGASRAVDALEYLAANDPGFAGLLDLDKLAVIGFSRWGKGALVAGMMDERFKVTHAGASGSGGAAPYRFMPFGNEYAWGRTDGSEVLGDHMRHQTHNSNEMMRRFLNDTTPATVQGRMYQTRTHGYGERLPFDHHLEIAAIAPRAVFIANTNDDYGNNAEGDAIGYQGAKPVFEWLGAVGKLALDIDMGGGGHSLKVSQQRNFVRFLDHVLFGAPLPGETEIQLRKDPYLTGTPGGSSIYDQYYGGLGTMMPWLRSMPKAPR
jgi:endo-1,4-beta-xylanase